MECVICYSNIGNTSLSCFNPDCTGVVCKECTEQYLEVCGSNNMFPMCPVPECRSAFIYKQLVGFDDHVIELYIELCNKHLYNYLQQDIQEYDLQQQMIKKIRKDRHEFMSTFPPAILFIIENALEDKKKKVDRENIKHMKNVNTGRLVRRCINTLCTGTLDKDFVCVLCCTSFCPKCEKPLTKEHTCNKEDITTIEEVNNLPRCPSCGVHIYKYEGCRNMTCANCKTQFDYYTGERISIGSGLVQEEAPDVKVKISYTLKDYLGKEYNDLMNKYIDLIQVKQPKLIKFGVETYVSLKDNPLELAKRYSNHIESKEKVKQYYKLIDIIRQNHDKKTLSTDLLIDIYKKL